MHLYHVLEMNYRNLTTDFWMKFHANFPSVWRNTKAVVHDSVWQQILKLQGASEAITKCETVELKISLALPHAKWTIDFPEHVDQKIREQGEATIGIDQRGIKYVWLPKTAMGIVVTNFSIEEYSACSMDEVVEKWRIYQ